MATTYTPDMGRNFWFDLDNQTLWNRTDEFTDVIQRAYFANGLTFDSLVSELHASFARPDHPAQFVARIEASRQGLIDLGKVQRRIIDAHLPDAEAVRLAFEGFGQGLLFDDRPPRPPGRHVHQMDGSPDNWVGWQRWYAAMRAAHLLSEEPEPWLQLMRVMALAWAIQTEANPDSNSPDNPGLAPNRLEILRQAWLGLSVKRLDWAFATHRFRAPTPDALSATLPMDHEGAPEEPAPAAANMGRYAEIQGLLERATGNLSPLHAGAGRFWLKPHAEFVGLSIYGQPLIAEPGADRGARSAIVKVLRGELAGFPRMPLNADAPMPDEDIEKIRAWIDAGAPEH